MTCIVGLTNGKTVWMGADSAATNMATGESVLLRESKLFRLGPLLVGCSGSIRAAQQFRYDTKLPRRTRTQSPMAYLTTVVCDVLAPIYEEAPDNVVPEILIGYDGRLYEISSGRDVLEPMACYHAVGSGAAFALGSLHSTTGLTVPDLTLEDRVHLALCAAGGHVADVRPPYTIEQL